MKKDKNTNNDLQNTTKTENRTTRTPLKTASGTHCVSAK